MKHLALALATAAAFAFGLPGAARAADYAFVLKTLANPHFVAMKEGVLAEARKRGVQVDIFAAAGEDDITGQQRIMEDVVNKNYKAVGVVPISPVNLVQAMASASRKGIYVVNVDEGADMGQIKAAAAASSPSWRPTTWRWARRPASTSWARWARRAARSPSSRARPAT